MKLNYKLKVCLMVIGFSFIGSISMATNILEAKVFTQNSESWVMVKNENGIKIYLKEEILPEGRFIAIKFENNSTTEISFSWELTKNEKIAQKGSDKITLNVNESEVFFDPTLMLKLENDETINHISINIL